MLLRQYELLEADLGPIEVHIAGNGTGTANEIFHSWISVSHFAVCSLGAYFGVPNAIWKFIFSHIWDPITHDASGIERACELRTHSVEPLCEVGVVADATNNTKPGRSAFQLRIFWGFLAAKS